MNDGKSPVSSRVDGGLDEKSNHYLVFQVGQERFACPLLQVKEVVRVPQVKTLPHQVRFLKGIVNLKGQVLSVMDLGLRLGFSECDLSSAPLMFIVAYNGVQLGLIVGTAEAVVKIPPESVEVPLSIHPNVPFDFLIGVGKIGEDLVHILDLEKLVGEFVPKKSEAQKERTGT